MLKKFYPMEYDDFLSLRKLIDELNEKSEDLKKSRDKMNSFLSTETVESCYKKSIYINYKMLFENDRQQLILYDQFLKEIDSKFTFDAAMRIKIYRSEMSIFQKIKFYFRSRTLRKNIPLKTYFNDKNVIRAK